LNKEYEALQMAEAEGWEHPAHEEAGDNPHTVQGGASGTIRKETLVRIAAAAHPD
jgi:hypothetical protein